MEIPTDSKSNNVKSNASIVRYIEIKSWIRDVQCETTNDAFDALATIEAENLQ